MAPEAAANPDAFHEADVAYALDRAGYSASGRLMFQHYLWKDATGCLIHPSILSDVGGGGLGPKSSNGEVETRIADVGTGTGAWALDVAALSGVDGIDNFIVHGFDISDEQFPPAHILPENVRLSVGDALADVPDGLRGTFDIVHVAHFAGVRALGDDPGPVIRHALALLKPGGWIQWDEWTREVEVVTLSPSPHCDTALGVSAKIFPPWLHDIAGHLSKHGVVQSARHDSHPRNTLLPGLTALWYMTAEEVIKIGFEEPTRSMMMQMLLAAHKETKDPKIRAMFRMCPSSVVGKKPVDA